ncbi:penicillin-binding transpeptidase domain-containing protein [Brevibacillus borstelensis]|uniref:penicillin-binding transpeptidase domain-containing protein n=2 Tax=Brevibacillus borstelensis TaxID=45462 RepID=UPI003C6C9E06
MKKQVWTMAAFFFILALVGCSKQEENPEDVAQAYLSDWQQQHFSEMYEQLTPEAKAGMTAEQFAQRYEKIYDGIEAKNLSIEKISVEQQPAGKDEAEKAEMTVPYHVKMDTVAGPLDFDHQLKLKKTELDKETKWLIEWEPSLIFPQMEKGDKVRVQTIKAERGEILDRHGNGLALNGAALQLGIIPGKLGESAEKNKAELAEKLGISVEEIDKKLSASWVKPDLFVPIAFVGEETAAEYRNVPWVSFQDKKLRVYPYGEAAAHLTGYIGEMSAEELKRHKDRGYRIGDQIGKAGLEQVFEDRLRGKKGAVIAVADEKGKQKAVIAETKAVPGETIKLTIDASLQQAIYDEVKQESASVAAVQPKTGEILALSSSPSYDPNAFIRGLSSRQYEQWQNDPRNPFLNRFSKGYSPGSSFKVVTAAIGLDINAIDPGEEKQISGLTWAKDGSWGNYFVTRVHAAKSVNLLKSLIYSDNIYFAQAALQIGAEAFEKESAKFGIGEALPIPYPFSKSQLSNSGIQNEILLADTGYGQGEVKMTTLHVALVYSALVNEGNIPRPLLLEDGKTKEPGIWKEQAMTPETAALLRKDLIQAVSSPDGVGHGAYIPGKSIAGKTGTAELKQSKDADGQENGWFVGFDADAPELLLSMMVEDVKGRGGSSVVTKKVKRIFQQVLKNAS